jgi:hypothetical protein
MVWAVLSAAAAAQAQYIYIDLSYKVILNPADGTSRPLDGSGNPVTDQRIDNTIDGMNQLLDNYSRGFRFRRRGPVWEVGGDGTPTDPSQWFNQDFLNNGGKDAMEGMASQNWPQYEWKFSDINIYINQGNPGGICSFPHNFWFDENIIIIGASSYANTALTLHEIGHYFNLFHTQGKSCGDCTTCSGPESDEIDDTLEDRACWGQDAIAMNTFSLSYASLSAANQKRVDDTFFNIMSYHGNRSRMTEDQLDRWTVNALRHRDEVLSGRPLFVSASGCISQDGNLNCDAFNGPFSRVIDGVNAAGANDIVVILPGSYNQTMTINKAVTLYATRRGPATIGRAP